MTSTLFGGADQPIIEPYNTGYLQVSDGHQLYFAQYGSPEGVPVVVLHGGPGTGIRDNMIHAFDLTLYRVVAFDQRGAMRSKPFGSMRANTTPY